MGVWWDYLYSPEFWEWDDALWRNSTKLWLVSILLGFWFHRRLNQAQRRIFHFALYSFIMENVSTNKAFHLLTDPPGNSYLYHLFTPGLFWMVCRVYAPVLFVGWWRSLSWVLPLAFALLVLFYALPGRAYTRFPSAAVVVYSLGGMALALTWFFQQLRSLSTPFLEREPLFWFSAGMLIYMSGNLLIWASISLLSFNREFFDSVYAITRVLTALFILLICLILVLAPSRSRPTLIHQT